MKVDEGTFEDVTDDPFGEGRHPEHPEDRAAREEGERYAEENAAAFCLEHGEELGMLVSVWADRDAADILDSLRESFWSRIYAPAPPMEKPE